MSHPLAVARILAGPAPGRHHAVRRAIARRGRKTRTFPISVIAKEFGPEVARLVEGVTKISRLELKLLR